MRFETAVGILLPTYKLPESKVAAEYPNQAERQATEPAGYEHPSTPSKPCLFCALYPVSTCPDCGRPNEL
jgi:hypothetical protein